MAQTIQQRLAEQPPTGSQPIQYMATVDAYDKWAEVYDTDGNFLQRLDTIEMRALLPRFLDHVSARFGSTDQLTLVDLGCGTGRNTIQMLEALSQKTSLTATPAIEVVGLDASPGMLEVARTAIQASVSHRNKTEETHSPASSLAVFDLLQPDSGSAQLPPSLRGDHSGAAGVISTLVLEHIPLKEFFAAASAMMRPGAYLLVTNMHADMGARSQAGFTDPETGVKIRPTSYCHSIPEVRAAADEAGFLVADLVGETGENGVLVRDVDERLGNVLGDRAKKWVGVQVWFGVSFRKRE
ncbi:hypothetical protein NUU61_006399 [Penicillium alfredii]|uniref:Methyltransferase type 12 domain-containing protein n=1 Tax=Penicillium alfredii TaxID=1506179 RepID=A0A9W9K3A5_9EURO|nr:uncharacterized protein NUU61_006399 [Penicillium alfredii]KAJ5091529.1 hypothetical protein NUU61_006399 [Penicillium alfredii]